MFREGRGGGIYENSTDLNHSHGQSGLFGQLLADVSRRFGSLREGVLQDLQLFGLDGGARTSSLGPRSAFIRRLGFRRIIAAALAFTVTVHRTCDIRIFILFFQIVQTVTKHSKERNHFLKSKKIAGYYPCCPPHLIWHLSDPETSAEPSDTSPGPHPFSDLSGGGHRLVAFSTYSAADPVFFLPTNRRQLISRIH